MQAYSGSLSAHMKNRTKVQQPFLKYVLSHCIPLIADLVDQLCNSSEKCLEERTASAHLPPVSHEMLATIDTTRLGIAGWTMMLKAPA